MLYTYYKHLGGNNIAVRYKTDDDPKTKNKVIKDYEPSLFTQSEEETGYKSIFGVDLKKNKLGSINEAKDFANRYKGVRDFVLEGNSNYGNQFIIELYDGKTPEYTEDQIRFGALDIEVHSTDGFPDPEEAKWPMTAVCIYDSIDKMFYLFGLKNKPSDKWSHLQSPEIIKELNVTYFEFEHEEDLMRSFLSHMDDHQYDLTTGWNSKTFDMPYIVNRSYQLLGETHTKRMLSPFNRIDFREVKAKYGKKTQMIVDIVGLPHLDYMEVYKSHTYTPRSSYRLDYIATAELNERKLSYEEAGSLENLYTQDYQLYLDYNIQDVNIIVRLEEKLGLLSLVYAMSYYTLSNFEDAMGTVKIWEQLVAKYLYNENKVPLFSGESHESRDFDGAFVKDVIPGRHKWIVSQDLNSLYPHIEMQWNIGLETHIPNERLHPELIDIREKYTFNDLLDQTADLSALKKHNVAMTANFEFYDRSDMSFFSAIKRDLYNQRKVVKRAMLDAESELQKAKGNKVEVARLEGIISKANNMQLGLKVLLNGGYGALGNKHFLYYKVENAEAITLSGQLVNRTTAGRLEQQLKDMMGTKKSLWVAGDTDSMYMTISPFMDTIKEPDIQKKVDIADRFCKEVIDPLIDVLSEDLCSYVNGYEQKMKWEREVIAETAIWVAKKKYVMHVWDSEGVRFTDKPKLKITGMESVKSITPEWSKKLLERCYDFALYGKDDEMYDMIEASEVEYRNYEINDIAIPSGVNGIDKYYDPINTFVSGCPKHVRASIVHNMMLEKLEINTIQPISDGDKIKWIPLKMPNPTRQPVVAFDTYLPKEFGLDDYVDRKELRNRSFVSPLTLFLTSIGWEPERTNTLF